MLNKHNFHPASVYIDRDVPHHMPVIFLPVVAGFSTTRRNGSQGVNAMQFLQRAKNIGKVVISFLVHVGKRTCWKTVLEIEVDLSFEVGFFKHWRIWKYIRILLFLKLM